MSNELRPQCRVIGCNRPADAVHHVWSGRGNRVPCVFQPYRKSGTPGGKIHKAGCECNLLPLCHQHHQTAHLKGGDLWLLENTNDYYVELKCYLTNQKE
jgi:hypothetical protein